VFYVWTGSSVKSSTVPFSITWRYYPNSAAMLGVGLSRYNEQLGDASCCVLLAAAKKGCMFEVTVDDSFAAGHYLRNYRGKCENPHGHNYKVRITLAGRELDKAGLLLDFKDLREVMKHAIERLDHQMINDIEPFTVLNPSAENLAKYFYDRTNEELDRVSSGRVRVKNVTVFETDTTTATYSEP
jgi:6-pyruvoyltetrahydropterin/6-carboxytetrahydropterin synthase